jgi:hypothetical protein
MNIADVNKRIKLLKFDINNFEKALRQGNKENKNNIIYAGLLAEYNYYIKYKEEIENENKK